jgi:peptide/nickel transport system substrate-binding protein
MYTTTMTQPDPQRFMGQYLLAEASQKANKWSGRNICRWTNDEYEKTYVAAESELDPVKRAALLIRLNDLPIKDNVIVPIASRPRVYGSATKLALVLSGWDLAMSTLHDWHRDA